LFHQKSHSGGEKQVGLSPKKPRNFYRGGGPPPFFFAGPNCGAIRGPLWGFKIMGRPIKGILGGFTKGGAPFFIKGALSVEQFLGSNFSPGGPTAERGLRLGLNQRRFPFSLGVPIRFAPFTGGRKITWGNNGGGGPAPFKPFWGRPQKEKALN